MGNDLVKIVAGTAAFLALAAAVTESLRTYYSARALSEEAAATGASNRHSEVIGHFHKYNELQQRAGFFEEVNSFNPVARDIGTIVDYGKRRAKQWADDSKMPLYNS